MQFETADYILAGLAIVCSILGLFRGFSGTLAFLTAVCASSAVATFGSRFAEPYFDSPWAVGGVVLVATLLVFGLVRWAVKRMVNGLLAQPTDAIFGFLTGLLAVGLIVVLWAWSGFHVEYSNVVSEVSKYVR